MTSPVTATDTSFKAEVLDSNIPVLVDFWASWCSPCKLIAPIVEELAKDYDGKVKMVKLDIDANPVTPGLFSVMAIPTLILFKGGESVERIVGYQSKSSLKGKIDAVLAPSA